MTSLPGVGGSHQAPRVELDAHPPVKSVIEKLNSPGHTSHSIVAEKAHAEWAHIAHDTAHVVEDVKSAQELKRLRREKAKERLDRLDATQNRRHVLPVIPGVGR